MVALLAKLATLLGNRNIIRVGHCALDKEYTKHQLVSAGRQRETCDRVKSMMSFGNNHGCPVTSDSGEAKRQKLTHSYSVYCGECDSE